MSELTRAIRQAQQTNAPSHAERASVPPSWRFLWCEECHVNMITAWEGPLSCPSCNRELDFRFRLCNEELAERFEYKEAFPERRSRANEVEIFKIKLQNLRMRAALLTGFLKLKDNSYQLTAFESGPAASLAAAFAILEGVK
jgi:hypothetical protein